MIAVRKARDHRATETRAVAQLVMVDLLKHAVDLSHAEIAAATARINVTQASIRSAIGALVRRGRVGARDVDGVRRYFLRTWR